jgi:hypothetical protein
MLLLYHLVGLLDLLLVVGIFYALSQMEKNKIYNTFSEFGAVGLGLILFLSAILLLGR